MELRDKPPVDDRTWLMGRAFCALVSYLCLLWFSSPDSDIATLHLRPPWTYMAAFRGIAAISTLWVAFFPDSFPISLSPLIRRGFRTSDRKGYRFLAALYDRGHDGIPAILVAAIALLSIRVLYVWLPFGAVNVALYAGLTAVAQIHGIALYAFVILELLRTIASNQFLFGIFFNDDDCGPRKRLFKRVLQRAKLAWSPAPKPVEVPSR